MSYVNSRKRSKTGGSRYLSQRQKNDENTELLEPLESSTEAEGDETTDTEVNENQMQVQLQRRSSVSYKPTNLLELNKKQLKFFEYISNGNISGVKDELLRPDGNSFQDEEIDINTSNINGYTALQIAVQREDEEMVELLLNIDGMDLKDTLFLAIKEDNLQLVKTIIECESDEPTTSPREQKLASERCTDLKNRMMNSEFEEDIQPLMLAAHIGSFQLIEYFFSLGVRLPTKPQHEGINASKLKESFERFRWYKAISNPYYISFMANEDDRLDPVLQAFNLADEMQKLSEKEIELKAEYEGLIDGLREYTGDLLDLCRTTEEVNLVCCQREGYDHPSKHSRILLAMQRGQIDFVAHSFAQEILYKNWTGDWRNWDQMHFFVRVSLIVLHSVSWIPLSPWLLFDRKTYWAQFFLSPVNRFLRSLGSYLFFLILLILECTLPYDVNDEAPPRNLPLAIVHCLLFLFVLGHLASTLKLFLSMPMEYFKLLWNAYEVITQVIFMVTFALWLWALLIAVPSSSTDKNFNRKNWKKYSPILMAESLFAVATIMSFGRLLRIFQLHHRFGPLQIALGYMIRDYGMGLVFYGITIFSFAQGMCMIYKSYNGWVDFVNGTAISYEADSFTSFMSSFESLFWALFNLANIDGLVIITIHENHTLPPVEHHHEFTQWVGKFLFKAFQALNVLMFANTIMSMISNTAGAVFENKDREWRFARTQVWQRFGRDTAVPSPFSTIGLFVNPGLFRQCGLWTDGKIFEKGSSRTRGYYVDEVTFKEDQRKRTEYAILVKSLLQRYFRGKGEEGMDDPATSQQVTRLREDVVEMKEKCKRVNAGVNFMLNRHKPLARTSVA